MAIIKVEDDKLEFWCTGCGAYHSVPLVGDDPWFFDGDYERPTILPSLVLHRVTETGKVVNTCHLCLTGGILYYLSDSEHRMRGQNIPLESRY